MRSNVFIAAFDTGDQEIAEALRAAVERFGGRWRRGQVRVFLDRAGLTTTAPPSGRDAEALRESSFFVLIASPETAQAPRVGASVRMWLADHDAGHVVIALVDGYLAWNSNTSDIDWGATTSLPRELAGAFTAEPVWISLRGLRTPEQRQPRRPWWRRNERPSVGEVVAPLVAVVRQSPTGALLAATRRWRRWLRPAAALVAVGLLVAAGGTALDHVARQREAARAGRNSAAARAGYLQGELVSAGDALLGLRLRIAAATVHTAPDTRASLLTALARNQYLGTVPAVHSLVQALALSPDGRVLAVADLNRDETVGLWATSDATKPRRVGTLRGYTAPVEALAFSGDGRTVVTGAGDQSVILWDVTDPSQPTVRARLQAQGAIQHLALSHNGAVLAVYSGAAASGALEVWNLADPARPSGGGRIPQPDVTYALAVSQDGRTLAVASVAGGDLWDLSSINQPRRLASLPGIDRPLETVAFSPDGRWLATTDLDSRTALWSLADPVHPRVTNRGHIASTGSGLQFSQDGGTLLMGGRDRMITALATANSLSVRATIITPNPISHMTASADGELVAAVNPGPRDTAADDTVRLWRLIGMEEPAQVGAVPNPSGIAVPAPGGRTVALATGDQQSIRLLSVDDPAHPRVLRSLQARFLDTDPVAFSPDGNTMVVSSWQSRGQDRYSQLQVWDVTDARQQQPGAKLPVPVPGTSGPVAVSRAGLTAAASVMRTDGTPLTMLWDLTDAAHPRSYTAPAALDGSKALLFSPNSGLLAAIGADGRNAGVWDVSDLSHPRRLAVTPSKGQPIQAIAFRPDSHGLAVGLFAGLELWDLTDTTHPRRQGAYDADAIGLAYSPDGSALAISGDNGTSVWDVKYPEAAARYATVPDQSGLTSPAISEHTLLTGDSSSGVTLWSATEILAAITDPISSACALVGRGLTAQEWRKYLPEVSYRPTCAP